LKNHWTFHDDPDGCRVEFFLEFEFNSAMLQKLIGVLFHEAVRRMVAAFEARAKQLYG
jgi:coenzyme Q-binding protein COQ10